MDLMLDGKPIGKITPQGKITDHTGREVPSEPTDVNDPEQMTVPLDHPILYGKRGLQPSPDELFKDQPEGGDEDGGDGVVKPVEGEPTESDSELALTNKILSKQVAAMQKQLNAKNIPATVTADPETGKIVANLTSAIPDDIKTEDDPYGLIRTMKNVAKAVGDIHSKVERLDKHAGYGEYQRALETEKSDFKEIFEDKKLGALANKLLDAELQTNSTDPLGVIVTNVVQEIRALGVKTPKTRQAVKDKIRTAGSVPPVLRSSAGSAPTITVNKPRNVTEAREQYNAWKSARARATRG